MASSVLNRLVSKSEIISDLDSQHNVSLLNSNFIFKCFFSAYISEWKKVYLFCNTRLIISRTVTNKFGLASLNTFPHSDCDGLVKGWADVGHGHHPHRLPLHQLAPCRTASKLSGHLLLLRQRWSGCSSPSPKCHNLWSDVFLEMGPVWRILKQ